MGIPVLLIGLTYDHRIYAEELNQTGYCHNHYGNGTVVCHKMPKLSSRFTSDGVVTEAVTTPISS